jgi:hypothetical protein
VLEAVVDEVIEADVIVPREPHGTLGTVAAAKKPCGNADQDEGQCE